MSNHLAIATVTATLQRTLQATVQTDLEGARITTVSPSDIGKGTPDTGVNIFMYQVITNPALHNIDATPLRSRGQPVMRQAALDLYYMFSFYGNNNELAPQRLLGSVVRTLNDNRVVTSTMIRDACADSTFSFLEGSRLADQLQQITIVPLDLNLEDLSKTWSVFFQTPYVLSIAYKVLVVLVEGQEPPLRSLPVRDRRSGGLAPFPSQPKVDKITAQAGPFEPIVVDSTLVIKGEQLKGYQHTQVRIGRAEVTPTHVSPTQLIVPLSLVPRQALRAGIQSLQVIHPLSLAEADRPQGRRGVESAAAPFVLRPRVIDAIAEAVEDTDDDLCAATIVVRVNLLVGPRQRVALALNEWSVEDPAAYMFDAAPRDQDTDRLTVPVWEVKPGEYLARLMIDGAESQLAIDTDEHSPTHNWYIGPRVLIDSP